MSQLIEQRSRKAARILDSARELVLDHGVRKVTVSEIARTAGVGKGTVYLYWAAKEDLILGLFARELLTFLDEIIARITADPATVLPRRLAPLLIRTGLGLPLGSRLKTGDGDLLRLLTRQAEDRDLFARVTPSSVCDAAMPIFRRRGLIRDDRPLASQAYAVHAVITGFGITMSDPTMAPPGVDDPAEVLADTVAQQLEPSVEPAEPAIATAADEVIAVLRESRDAVLELIESSQLAGE
ncbi:TetR/AcrR family transcriptional regulator [Streptomyces sp. NL15-2K]|uniref:TetR/AcrR family transcriptional regulator n=1 Tax=Streptomyces sp. NL15-2K TaxID=376149 RepID=UPI000FF9876A|nr:MULTISPECIES: TetR/AcrR family transcriptional regulator [Actinomycetes]WKX06308.1 helix-turn-helix domain-containing protein [Kutzneria buriramensis]GCB43296.1 tetR family transcriptional regulator [Streptomyces sp. NL15-2K]